MSDQPGLTPYTPTKIEWLALTVNSQLQYERHASDPYELYVVQADHDTLQIFIQYLPAVYPPVARRRPPAVSYRRPRGYEK